VEVPIAVRSLGIELVQTSFVSPWQNGVAECWVQSCRRGLLDHVILVNERHLKRLLCEYVRDYHEHPRSRSRVLALENRELLPGALGFQAAGSAEHERNQQSGSKRAPSLVTSGVVIAKGLWMTITYWPIRCDCMNHLR
jgi:hypothetical protein